MFTLLKKELSSFFNSLIAYIVIIVFLLSVSLFLWVFPGNFNLLDLGYARLDSLFVIAPWVFLFLVPAITMRLFSEEMKTGTIELLLTKPFTELQIVISKYLAALILIFVALIPSVIYFISIYLLGDTIGNLDIGGSWGSYIGLLFLASVYVSIGLFVSSITDNQIIAFIVSVFLCFFIFIGFDSIASLSVFSSIQIILQNLGINEHYRSISRGVIDSRDLLYFFSVVIMFIYLASQRLKRRKWLS